MAHCVSLLRLLSINSHRTRLRKLWENKMKRFLWFGEAKKLKIAVLISLLKLVIQNLMFIQISSKTLCKTSLVNYQ